jgi:hypothetical protein
MTALGSRTELKNALGRSSALEQRAIRITVERDDPKAYIC